MKEFRGKVAVVTGAASGIGRAIAERAAQEGMKVVLADIEEPALAQAKREMEAAGVTVLAVPTDVARADDVDALARRTLGAFGAVHLLVNNAGVGAGGPPWECTPEQWQWVLGVNLWGVIHGLRVFVPIMLAQDTECHIVNTASTAGLMPSVESAPYTVSKYGVVGLSENLQLTLAKRTAKIGASVLCPSWVRTRILESGRNCPPELVDKVLEGPLTPEQAATHARLLEGAMPPQQVAEQVFEAIRAERFYIVTHPEHLPLVAKRTEDIVQGHGPSYVPGGTLTPESLP